MGDHREPTHRAWPLFLRTHSVLIELLRAELAEAKGLPLTWLDVLIQLSIAPERRRPMHELAESLVLSKSGVTRLVDRMAEAGLVTREPCASDRRVTYASLTENGSATLEEALPVHLDGVRRLFEQHLEPAEAEIVAGALAKILDASTAHPDGRAVARSGVR